MFAPGLSVLLLLSTPSADPAVARTDLAGDPLPQGAVARLGTTRYRGRVGNAFLSADGAMVVLCDENSAITWMEADTGKTIRSIAGVGVFNAQCTQSHDGRYIAFYGRAKSEDPVGRPALCVYDLVGRKAPPAAARRASAGGGPPAPCPTPRGPSVWSGPQPSLARRAAAGGAPAVGPRPRHRKPGSRRSARRASKQWRCPTTWTVPYNEFRPQERHDRSESALYP